MDCQRPAWAPVSQAPHEAGLFAEILPFRREIVYAPLSDIVTAAACISRQRLNKLHRFKHDRQELRSTIPVPSHSLSGVCMS